MINAPPFAFPVVTYHHQHEIQKLFNATGLDALAHKVYDSCSIRQRCVRFYFIYFFEQCKDKKPDDKYLKGMAILWCTCWWGGFREQEKTWIWERGIWTHLPGRQQAPPVACWKMACIWMSLARRDLLWISTARKMTERTTSLIRLLTHKQNELKDVSLHPFCSSNVSFIYLLLYLFFSFL